MDTGWVPPEGSTDGADEMGEPASRITTAVDVLPWIDRKRRAMEAHPSQIPDDSFFLSMPDPVFAMVWGTEWYIQVRPAPGVSGPGHWESDLRLEAAPAGDGRTASIPDQVMPT
jgi:hypothetical protein